MALAETMAPELLSIWPFGSHGLTVEVDADSLLRQLSLGRRRDQEGWQKADTIAFDRWAALEVNVERLAIPISLDAERRREFQQSWKAFHAALPFDEAEGDWLWKNYLHGSPRGADSYAELATLIANDDSEAEIVSSGIRRVVKARELASRWVPWRLGSGAYEGQESVALARDALASIVLLMHPSAELPKSYLRRSTDHRPAQRVIH
jgi:hypothetical protein